METTGFTLVSSGKKRETLKGAASLYYWPHLSEMQQRGAALKQCIDYLHTEVTVSEERHFRQITFIDTPGLVDGNLTYPYPVEEVSAASMPRDLASTDTPLTRADDLLPGRASRSDPRLLRSHGPGTVQANHELRGELESEVLGQDQVLSLQG
jgi:hypothetical protein